MPAFSATDGQRLAEELHVELMARFLTREHRQSPIENLFMRTFSLAGGVKMSITVVASSTTVDHQRFGLVYVAKELGGRVECFRPGQWVRELRAVYEQERPTARETGPKDRFSPLPDW